MISWGDFKPHCPKDCFPFLPYSHCCPSPTLAMSPILRSSAQKSLDHTGTQVCVKGTTILSSTHLTNFI